MAFKFAGAEAVSGPSSMRPSGAIAVADQSGLVQGIDNLAAGAGRLGQGLQQRADLENRRRSASELSQAEARWLSGTLQMGNDFERDTDWRTMRDRASTGTDTLKAEAANLITDPEVRQRWADETTLKQLQFVDAIGDQGRRLEEGEYRSNLETSLDTTTNLITDPTMSDQVRDKARQNIEGSISVAESLGMVTAAEGKTLRDKYLRGADVALDWNRLQLDLTFRPDYVLKNLGISSSMGGNDLAAAMAASSGGQAVALDPALASEVAARLGDAALPSDEKLRAAYLSDPEQNARYVGEALDMLTERYKGDMTAAVIAMAPGGGTAMADAWVKSGHDESKLPAGVQKFYRSTINGMKPAGGTAPLPTIAAPGVNVEGLNVGVIDRWESVQGAFGIQLPVISGVRSPEHNAEVGGAEHSRHLEAEGKDALDIDTSSLSKEEVLRLIQTAAAQGFTGYGIYGDGKSIHLDMGPRRAWGASRHDDSVPAWAKDTLDALVAGDIPVAPSNGAAVAPEYGNLPFDMRLKGYDQAKVAVAQKGLDMRAGLELAAQNAPVAIANTGTYDRPLPTAEDYVAAYGFAEGIERYKAFDASVDVANKAYGMRTMSSQDIAAMVEAATPTSTGDMAAIEQKSFETLSAAAQSVLKQREEDPVAYAVQTYPAVADAWAEAQESKDPAKFSQAIARTALAQEVLGIANPQLLPKEMAKATVDAFNNIELPQNERINAAVATVFATGDEGQQEAIYRQLVSAGMPRTTQAAMAALSRGDTAAAEYLFKASMFNPKDFPGKIPESDANIGQRISEKLLDDNQIGDVVYGLSDGTADNYQRLADDGALMTNAVKLRLLDGSASSLEQAIDMTARDMWGDVEVVTGKSYGGGAGVKVLMPKGEDKTVMLDGFNALLPTIGDAIMADLTPSMASTVNTAGEAAIMSTARDLRVSTILSEGYFTAQGNDAYVFIDSMTGQPVPDPSGDGPLTFSRDAVLDASAGSRAAAAVRLEEERAQGKMAPAFGPGVVDTTDPYFGN